MKDYILSEYVDCLSYVLSSPTEVDVDYFVLKIEALTEIVKEYITLYK